MGLKISSAKDKNATASQIPLSWLLAQGNDIVPIPGTKKPEYLQENLAAVDVTRSTDDLKKLQSLLNDHQVQGGRLPEMMEEFNWKY